MLRIDEDARPVSHAGRQIKLPAFCRNAWPISRLGQESAPIGPPGALRFRVLLLIMAASLTLLGIILLDVELHSLQARYVYGKDFIQDYLLAKAVLKGANPYAPLPQLVDQFIGHLPYPVFPQPSPHPPPSALLSLPLGALTYPQAAALWFLFEVICVLLAVYMLLRRWCIRPAWVFAVLGALWLFALNPFMKELVAGQLMTVLLVLTVGAWLALDAHRPIWGGVLLGCAVALKLIVWPLVILLALRRNWRATVAAVVTIIGANLAAALVMGFDRVSYYYLEVSRIVAPLYRAYEGNFSLWSVGWRLFDGTGSAILDGIKAPPLIAAPVLAPYVAVALPLALLIIGLVLAMRSRSFDTAFGIMICVSILVSPIAWNEYLVLALIPAVGVVQSLSLRGWPKRESRAAITIGLLLIVPDIFVLHRFVLSFADPTAAGSAPTVPFAAGLLTLLPLAATLGLLWLVWELGRTANVGGSVKTT